MPAVQLYRLWKREEKILLWDHSDWICSILRFKNEKKIYLRGNQIHSFNSILFIRSCRLLRHTHKNISIGQNRSLCHSRIFFSNLIYEWYNSVCFIIFENLLGIYSYKFPVSGHLYESEWSHLSPQSSQRKQVDISEKNRLIQIIIESE